jgi:hypothetical protein
MIPIYKMQIAALTTENIGLKAQLVGNAAVMAAQQAELAALRAYVASIAADVEYIELRTPMLGGNVVMLPGAEV